MNIKRAKEEIKDTIEAYLLKDTFGNYEIPSVRQRPVLLIGAPGIGKTQIMEQIAQECKVGLVSYTITHHTRQSAIGLPFISKKEYGGMPYSVTEYTMSEIVASVYEKIEKTGLFEGILFIDEINCVSETLAPAMLQFLQCKTFGNHAIPEGWVIVAAGNPPEYNKSVREFDVVTMDRVKKIEVEPDFQVWKEYAYKQEIHPAVLSYLNTKPGYFYRMETTVDGRMFATPRGWEDLSRLIQVYGRLQKTVDREVVVQYIQHPKIAKDFANYVELFEKYQMDEQVEQIFQGKIGACLLRKAAHASFDERLSVVAILFAECAKGFREVFRKESVLTVVFEALKEMKAGMLTVHREQPLVLMQKRIQRLQEEWEQKRMAEVLSKEEDGTYGRALETLESYRKQVRDSGGSDGEAVFGILQELFQKKKQELELLKNKGAQNLEYAFDFMESAFGNGQEMVIFVTELNASYDSVRFLQEYECERYARYNEQLLFEEGNRDILRKLEEIQTSK